MGAFCAHFQRQKRIISVYFYAKNMRGAFVLPSFHKSDKIKWPPQHHHMNAHTPPSGDPRKKSGSDWSCGWILMCFVVQVISSQSGQGGSALLSSIYAFVREHTPWWLNAGSNSGSTSSTFSARQLEAAEQRPELPETLILRPLPPSEVDLQQSLSLFRNITLVHCAK